MSTSKIAIFASGNGTNAEEFFKHFRSHAQIHVDCLLSNNTSAYALVRARNYGVATRTFNREEFYYTKEIQDFLQERVITDIVLAGFLWLLPKNLLNTYDRHIYNIHPALLPKYGGKGMYGEVVHEAVLDAGEIESGITIHHVNEKYDEGDIIFQARCPVNSNDSAKTLANRIHQLEYEHFPRVVESCILSGDER